MASFCLWLWAIILVFGVLFWRRYPPGHEFRRASLLIVVLGSIILPGLAIADWQDAADRAEHAAAVEQLENAQRIWRKNHPQQPTLELGGLRD